MGKSTAGNTFLQAPEEEILNLDDNQCRKMFYLIVVHYHIVQIMKVFDSADHSFQVNDVIACYKRT